MSNKLNYSDKHNIISYIKNNVCYIILDRPNQKNALTGLMFYQLAKLFKIYKNEKVIVLTSNGDSFSSGVDLKDSIFSNKEYIQKEFDLKYNIFHQMRIFKGIIICGLPGLAITGGMELALNTDIRIGTDLTYFRDTHMQFGICPSGGLTVILQKLMNYSDTLEFLSTGRKMHSQELLQKGLLQKIVQKEKLFEELQKLAEIISQNNEEITYQIKSNMIQFNQNIKQGIQEIEIAKKYHLQMAEESDTQQKLNLNLQKSKL